MKARQAKVAEYLKVGLDNIFKWVDDLHRSGQKEPSQPGGFPLIEPKGRVDLAAEAGHLGT